MAGSKNGGVTFELTQQSKKNLEVQMAKLKKLAPETAKKGMFKLLFDIKALAQNKLKSDSHIVTSRLRNSIYVQADSKNKKYVEKVDNKEYYRDKNKKEFKSELDVQLDETEGAVGTNVEYGSKIEYLYDSFLYWALKNVDLDKRWRDISAELLNGLK